LIARPDHGKRANNEDHPAPHPRTLFLALVFCCVTVAAIVGIILGSTLTIIAAVGVLGVVFFFAGALRPPP